MRKQHAPGHVLDSLGVFSNCGVFCSLQVASESHKSIPWTVIVLMHLKGLFACGCSGPAYGIIQITLNRGFMCPWLRLSLHAHEKVDKNLIIKQATDQTRSNWYTKKCLFLRIKEKSWRHTSRYQDTVCASENLVTLIAPGERNITGCMVAKWYILNNYFIGAKASTAYTYFTGYKTKWI